MDIFNISSGTAGTTPSVADIFASASGEVAWNSFWGSGSRSDVSGSSSISFSFGAWNLYTDWFAFDFHWDSFFINSGRDLVATEKSVHGMQLKGNLRLPRYVGKIKPQKHFPSRRMQFNTMSRGFENERIR
jgi:hypothetical protein